MLKITIPGYGPLELQHLVLDYNGTIACDGVLIDRVGEQLIRLSSQLTIHVVTADTFGKAAKGLEGIPCQLSVLGDMHQDQGKLAYIRQLAAHKTIAIGNGQNDKMMILEAALGIAVILEEGAAISTLMAADVVCNSITAALDLLLQPMRLVATLRN